MYVARMDPDRAEVIRQTLPPQLIVEEDAPLEYATPTGLRPGPTRLASWSSVGAVETRHIRIRVIGEGDSPLPNVGVSLTGEGFPQEGRTDKKGEITLPLIALAGRRARSLFATAPSNYWDHYLTEPEVSDGEVNPVRLAPPRRDDRGVSRAVPIRGGARSRWVWTRIPETLGKG